ncbi:MAG TPA: UbiA family prenyltransferase [Ferruginibacter sp.]|jgi:1,4-dihydroxy-2-naphthoate octaprenyltransferase|nr:UbiA family prenyltransferase [Ferruginibacter sp.]
MISAASIKLLRIPFSFFLAPLYFFTLAMVPHIDWGKAALIFFIMNFLIYPASNGYNSYMDKDTESIGGIEKPPPPSRQLFYLTIILDTIGILLSLLVSPFFAVLMLLYVAASKAYSYRGIRLKRFAIIGYLTVIIFQGALTFCMVYYGVSRTNAVTIPWQGIFICALLIGGFYPLTQIYQHVQDAADGVTTISYKLGYMGTFVFCSLVYLAAWLLMAQFFLQHNSIDNLLLITIFFIPIIIYFSWWFLQVKKDHRAANFKNTMRMNWIAATCTNTAFIILLIWNHFE